MRVASGFVVDVELMLLNRNNFVERVDHQGLAAVVGRSESRTSISHARVYVAGVALIFHILYNIVRNVGQLQRFVRYTRIFNTAGIGRQKWMLRYMCLKD